jgi:hypothetical protein
MATLMNCGNQSEEIIVFLSIYNDESGIADISDVYD